MKLVLQRLPEAKDSTPGMIWHEGACFCFTLEDERRDVKVAGETRIPAGRYDLKLRTAGGMHTAYKKFYGKAHAGMLWLQDVPGFEFIYLHPGNTPADTAGCILVGEELRVSKGEFSVGMSRTAYHRLRSLVQPELLAGKPVEIVILDPR